ncbi:hypothetical protein SAMN02745116_02391 [Pilibacter termitis]|uniref:Uncharacterized protein n=1 Tax=Pilibacter termitis TaxID=263852 RepID=A0A1T4R0P0_9ENTE|nr:hypothetical protein [Pilibacter termitis]SKA09281.1 hypothetical protein SAMN02745116_02391 [Pilibacter termitis]
MKLLLLVNEQEIEKEYAALLESKEESVALRCFYTTENIPEGNDEVIHLNGEKLRQAVCELFPEGFDGKSSSELAEMFEKKEQLAELFFRDQQKIVKKMVKYFLSPKRVMKLGNLRKYAKAVSDTKLPFSTLVAIGKDLLLSKKKFQMSVE